MGQAPDLHKIDAVDVFKLAVQQSGLPVTEIANRLGWTEHFMRRVFSTDKFFPSYPDLPAFCIAVGNRTVLHWLECRVETVEPEHQAIDSASLPVRLTDVFAELGDVARETRDAIEDDHIDNNERRRLIAELTDVLNVCLCLIGDLRTLDADA